MKYSRRQLLSMLMSLSFLPFLSACATKPLRIAGYVWPGYELMFLAAEEVWFSVKEIELLDFKSATAALQKLRDGAVDGAMLTLDEVLRLRADGIALTAVLVIDESAGSDVLLSRPGIRSVSGLTGKRIGVEQSALGAFMLHKVLDAAKIGLQDVTIVPMTGDQTLDVWRDGRADAVITYEPTATKIEASGAVRIFDSRQIPGAIVDVLAVRQSVLRTHAGPLRSLVLGHFKARRHLRVNPQDAAYHIAKRMNLSPPEVLNSFRGLELPGILRNHEYLGGSAPSLIATARDLSAVMVKAGLLARPDDLAGLIQADFLPMEEF